ncbi:MAG: patatin-like protein [Bacteroidales bacterium]
MIAPSSDEQAEGRASEVRLGVVMYGGISLAVYMNGVAQEFFNAVRGRGVYRLLKHLVDADIVVDVLSGTSAGGINAILLGYALANEREFSASAYMWRRFGAFGRLLHGPLDGPATSLLDTDGYYLPHLVEAMAGMGPIDDPSEDVSPTAELDLFVTATDFDGDRRMEFDESGHPVELKEHRSVFRLKHRADRLESSDLVAAPGDEGGVRRQALAKLAAITSALPVAFEPITVAAPAISGESVEPAGEVDWFLRRWGRLRERKYFLDGGVLVNKPFMPAIQAVATRVADRDVERHLCYVDPDPEHFKAGVSASAPGAALAATAALTALPWYQSIASDLQAVAERNSVVGRYNRLCANVTRKRFAEPRAVVDPWRIEDELYRGARLMALCDLVVGGVLARAVPPHIDARRAAGQLVAAFERWRERLDPERAGTVLKAFDVEFRRRRLASTVHEIQQALFGPRATNDPEKREQYRAALGGLNRSLQALDIVRSAMQRALEDVDFHWMSAISDDPDGQVIEIWSRVRRVLATVLQETVGDGEADPGDYTADALTAMNAELRRRVEDMVEGGVPARLPDGVDIFAALDPHELHLVSTLGEGDPLRRMYEEFAAVDAEMLPLELASGVHERCAVGTARFSPDDVEVAFSAAPRKVQGTKLAYFGAFMNESWRANDILWGRLDAAAELIFLLLNTTAYRRVHGARTRGHGRVAAGVAADAVCAASNLFPKSDARVMERVIEGLSRGEWSRRHVTLLIEATQREIIAEEMKAEMPHNDGTHPLTPDEFLAAYRVPDEGWLSMMRPGTVTMAARTAVALANLGLGLWWPKRDND